MSPFLFHYGFYKRSPISIIFGTWQTWTWVTVGSIHGLDWIGLGWVENFSVFVGWVGFAQLRDGVFSEEPTRV